jgi:cytoskeletal protein RodZ
MKLPTFTIARIQSRFSYGKRVMPVRDWFVLIALMSVLLLGSALWNAVIFYKTAHGEPLTLSTTHVEKVTVDETAPVTSIIEKREEKRRTYEAGPLFVDPGI